MRLFLSYILFTKCLLSFLIFLFFTAISLRLQGPSRAIGTGRVEIFYNGQWGTICDDYWNIQDAEVVCRELGYHYAIRALPGYLVPDGTGQIWLDNVGCNGREQNLTNCYHRGWGVHNCRHYDDAGVECSSTGIFITMMMIMVIVLFLCIWSVMSEKTTSALHCKGCSTL